MTDSEAATMKHIARVQQLLSDVASRQKIRVTVYVPPRSGQGLLPFMLTPEEPGENATTEPKKQT